MFGEVTEIHTATKCIDHMCKTTYIYSEHDIHFILRGFYNLNMITVYCELTHSSITYNYRLLPHDLFCYMNLYTLPSLVELVTAIIHMPLQV